MAQIEIYTRPMCGFCVAAKKLLNRKNAAFVEYNCWTESGRKDEMIQRSRGKMTFPQIFVDGKHIGGCDDLMALERSGKLDPMLAA